MGRERAAGDPLHSHQAEGRGVDRLTRFYYMYSRTTYTERGGAPTLWQLHSRLWEKSRNKGNRILALEENMRSRQPCKAGGRNTPRRAKAKTVGRTSQYPRSRKQSVGARPGIGEEARRVKRAWLASKWIGF